MHLRSIIQNRSRQGVALIIILAFLVLLSGAILAFFSRVQTEQQVSSSNLNETKADILAKSAFDLITGDLREEIAAKSSVGVQDGVPIYQPAAPENMRPISDAVATLPNMVRRSMAGRANLPVDSNPASSVSTAQASANNRQVRRERWNLHYLMPRLDASEAIDATPIADFKDPDWVMVTTNGPSAQTAPSSSVIGRFAYVIHNQGGLLDVNVAGYPSALPAGAAPHPSPNPFNLFDWGYARKGGTAFADLTQLPAATGSTLSQSLVDQLVGWRNYASAEPAGDIKTGFAFDATSAARFFDAARSPKNGGLLAGTAQIGLQTDQKLTSRQALVKFARSIGISQNALQHLGTFSREKNAPSWSPKSNASDLGGSNTGMNISNGAPIANVYAYKNRADDATAINRRFPNVRVVNDKGLERRNGTVSAKGEPLINSRFDLNRLGWIQHDGSLPAGVTLQDIYDFFGLTRRGDGAWVYNHGAPGSGKRINTLEEVAQANREPDFFELLQAGLLQGSLGLNSGDPTDATSLNGPGGEFYRLAVLKPRNAVIVRADNDGQLVYAQEKYQVIQIGVNIIDQAGEGNFPTEIILNGESFYGVKNLPYLNAFGDAALRPSSGSGLVPNDYQAYVHRWLTFSVWNPHQNATKVDPSGPKSFRILVRNGEVYSFPNGLSKAPNLGFDFSMNPAWLQFDLASYPNRFSEPTALTYDGTSSSPGGRIYTERGWKKAGIYLGYSFSPDDKLKVPECAPLKVNGGLVYRALSFDIVTPLTIELQYQEPGGAAWKTYQVLRGFADWFDGRGDPYMEPGDPAWLEIANDWSVSVNANAGPLLPLQESRVIGLLDPRSLRFNIPARRNRFDQNYHWRTDTNAFYTEIEQSPPAGNRFAGDWKMWSNNTDTGNRYIDRDNVNRPGDGGGWKPSTSTDNPQAVGSMTHRPIMLNRPFRSVGELGVVFRDEPWKTLNLFSSKGGDSALLDLFYVGSAEDQGKSAPAVVAGKVDINSASAPVLKAIIANAVRSYQGMAASDASTIPGSNTISATDSNSIANDIIAKVKTTPFVNVSEIPELFPQNTTSSTLYPGHKLEREAVVRALTDSTSTRTWNLLIDVIAQSGRYGPSAKTLDQFIVEGEKHYWLHVAIDRFTGEIVDQQLELVRE